MAFITPILLAKSSSAIYFLFGGVLALGIYVSIVYMPETRGRDLETIGEAFGLQSARDIPLVKNLQRLASRAARALGFTYESHVIQTPNQAIELQPGS